MLPSYHTIPSCMGEVTLINAPPYHTIPSCMGEVILISAPPIPYHTIPSCMGEVILISAPPIPYHNQYASILDAQFIDGKALYRPHPHTVQTTPT